jgi:hypothetical protein
MTVTKLKASATDTYWGIVDERARVIQVLATALKREEARHIMIRNACGHVANHAATVRKLNRDQGRQYDPSTDDSISALCDRIGLLLRDESLVRGIPDAHLAIMRAGVSAIRGALFARQAHAWREQQAQRFETVHKRAA